ncbi:MAG: hypothetical protein ACK8QZ_08915, partial [Anaerolineales bacterium]
MHLPYSLHRSLPLSPSLFYENGRLIPDFEAAHRLAPSLGVAAGKIYALALLNEVFASALQHFERNGALPLSSLLKVAEARLGAERLKATLLRFLQLFPPLPVFLEQITPAQYLQQHSSKEIVKEIILLYLENANPALIGVPFSTWEPEHTVKAFAKYTPSAPGWDRTWIAAGL